MRGGGTRGESVDWLRRRQWQWAVDSRARLGTVMAHAVGLAEALGADPVEVGAQVGQSAVGYEGPWAGDPDVASHSNGPAPDDARHWRGADVKQDPICACAANPRRIDAGPSYANNVRDAARVKCACRRSG
jgi:hypothetical protein